MENTKQNNHEMNRNSKKNGNLNEAQVSSRLKFYYSNFGNPNNFGIVYTDDGEFDLVHVDITEEKFVPRYQRNPEALGMI